MQSNTNQPPCEENRLGHRTLQLNFSWRKYTTIISETGSDIPLYFAKYNAFTMKTIFKTGQAAAKVLSSDSDVESINLEAENEDVIGNSRVKVFHIDCPTIVRGRSVSLSAASRLMTRYNYSSLAYASDPLKPAVMTWKSNSVVKAFNFDLLDEQQEIVARYNTKYLGVKKYATIELFGPKAWDSLATEEVLITGLTMYFSMIYRASSPVPLVGALVSREGKDFKVTEKEARDEYERNVAANSKGNLQPDGSTVDPKHMWDLVDGEASSKDPSVR
jgi:hypothetical protein